MALDRRTFSRFVARHRRGVSAVCAATAVLSLGLALRPPSPPTIAVPIASRALSTGHRLGPEDLTIAQVAAAITPPNLPGASSEALVGRVLAAPVLAGEPIVESRLVGTETGAWDVGGGTRPIPVRFADAAAVDLIDAGQRLDVLAAAAGEPGDAVPRARVVARDVLVLAVVRQSEADGGGLLGRPSASGDGAGRSDLVVLAATSQQSLEIAAAEVAARLTFTLAGPPPGPERSDGAPP